MSPPINPIFSATCADRNVLQVNTWAELTASNAEL